MKKALERGCSVGLAVILLLLQVALLPAAGAREVVDMEGQQLVLPEQMERVYVASPPENHLACAIDPDLMVGLNFPIREQDKKFLPPQLSQLPVIGGFFGLGHTPNLEVLLKAKPQLVICWRENAVSNRFDTFLQRFDIPLAYVTLERLQDYPRDIRLMGRLLGREQRAEKLAVYAEQSLAEILSKAAAIPQKERVRVYYALGSDGLRTDGGGTWHAELIDLAGGVNVHPGDPEDLFGMQQVSMEQVMLYRPEVILAQDPKFFREVFSSPRWRNIPAVKNGRVYQIPDIPFNWFDRPPSFMRLLGIKWVAKVLYPERFSLDMDKETREFFKLFLQVEPSRADLRSILDQKKGGKP
ncbi:MAG: ABC transporter substrate-binding protein [Syntrophotaleaceae bacterium]